MDKCRPLFSFCIIALVAMVVLIFPLIQLEAKFCCLKSRAKACTHHGEYGKMKMPENSEADNSSVGRLHSQHELVVSKAIIRAEESPTY